MPNSAKLVRIRVVDATLERAREAGKPKARGGISYADCFAAALAAEKGAWLVTGDPEFRRVADGVKTLWLGGGGTAFPGARPGVMMLVTRPVADIRLYGPGDAGRWRQAEGSSGF